ncbi:MAG TPA: siroheme synthase, partial [Gammaproteobacteria bacterium]|nr:siroheme synthase [Gammaproteobacteria bacterium]
ASGCSAYAGIPLTHRDHAQMVVFVTGHLKNNSVNVDVKTVARLPATLVIYMGLVGLAEICQQLVDHGRDRETPAALIESGTTASQRVISATLETLAEAVSREKVKAPTLVIVGDVVALRDQLKWFNSSIEQT